MSTFHSANSRGKVGEALISEWLLSRKWLVLDTSSHKLFQEVGVDFVIEKEGEVRCIDVKTDSYTTGNFYIETVSNDLKGTRGCIYTSRADDWFYYYSATHSLKLFNPQEMAAYIDSPTGQTLRRTKAASYIGNNVAYHSHGVLVPNDCPVVKATICLSSFLDRR